MCFLSTGTWGARLKPTLTCRGRGFCAEVTSQCSCSGRRQGRRARRACVSHRSHARCESGPRGSRHRFARVAAAAPACGAGGGCLLRSLWRCKVAARDVPPALCGSVGAKLLRSGAEADGAKAAAYNFAKRPRLGGPGHPGRSPVHPTLFFTYHSYHSSHRSLFSTYYSYHSLKKEHIY